MSSGEEDEAHNEATNGESSPGNKRKLTDKDLEESDGPTTKVSKDHAKLLRPEDLLQVDMGPIDDDGDVIRAGPIDDHDPLADVPEAGFYF